MKAKHILVVATALTLAGAFLIWTSMERFSEASAYGSLAKSSLFDSRIKAYILTTACERKCDHLTDWIPKGTFVLDGDGDDSNVPPKCKTRSQWDSKVVKTSPDSKSGLDRQPSQKFRPPENDEEREMARKDPDYKFRTPEFQQWMESIEGKYRHKYAQTLRECSRGDHELCMLLEDDIVFINEPDVNLFRLAVHTFAKYSGPEVSWDCAKRGNGWKARKIDGNKSQCRIVHRDYAGCLADYFETSSTPADVALASGMAHCQMKQKWFLLVQHIGRKSSMGHEQ